MTLDDLLSTSYLPEHALSLAPASVAQLRYSILAFSKHLGRPATLGDFERMTVLAFLAARQQKVSPATVNKDRRSLLCLWRHAAEVELCEPPKRAIPKAKCPVTVPHTFTPTQLHRLLDAAAHCGHPTFWRALLYLAYDTGARISALMATRISDVSFSNLTIRLAPEFSKTNTEQMLPISAEDTAPALAAQALGRDRSELLFPYRHNRRRLFIQFRELAVAAGIDLPRGKVFHSLRRTSATLCAAELGIEAACRKLGHSSVAVTKRYVDLSRVTPLRWLPPRP